MARRFVERKGIQQEIPDFIRRRHGIPLALLIFGYVALLVAVGISLYVMTPEILSQEGAVILASLCFSGIGILGAISIYSVHHSRDIIMATEFQNALFASALRMDSEFSLIIKEDGQTVYSDSKFHRQFSKDISKGGHGLDIILDHQGLTRHDREKLTSALHTGFPEKVPFQLEKNRNRVEQVALTIEPLVVDDGGDQFAETHLMLNPLDRPFGYYYVSGSKKGYLSEYENLLSNLEIGFYVTRNDDTFIHINQSFANLLGYSRSEIFANRMVLSDIIFRIDDADNPLEEDYQNEVVIRKQDGTSVCVYLKQVVGTTPDGQRKRKYGLITALPERTQSQVQASSDQVQVLPENTLDYIWDCFFEHSPVAIALLDQDGVIVQSNTSFSAFAIDKKQFSKGSKLFNLFVGSDRPSIDYLMSKANETGEGEQSLASLGVTLVSEEEKTATLYIGKLPPLEEGPPLIIAYLIDTTEQKNLEMRFVHSQKMQAVGQLAGGIAHDFNNLLTAMTGFCDLLLMRHPAGDPSFADIMQIKQNANRAANLVRQLLAFSRKQTLQPKVISLTDVLAELSNLVRRLIGENIELVMNHGRNIGNVKVDQGQLEQVIMNLAVNARDAMTEGGALTIQTQNVTVDKEHPLDISLVAPTDEGVIENGEYVLIEVIDTGTGIPKALVDKIFEPFFSTKEVGSGTGLGLATVYGIVKQTDGYIYVTTEEGKGTTFSIFLKHYEVDEAAAALEQSEAEEKAKAVDLTGTGTVLLVEDETPVRIFSAQALKNKGYHVLEAESGEAAIEIVEEKGAEIDVIVSDVVMPGMNGPAMVNQVLKDYPDIKVIFISGYSEETFLENEKTGESFAFLPKPFTLKQLAGKLKEVMEK